MVFATAGCGRRCRAGPPSRRQIRCVAQGHRTRSRARRAQTRGGARAVPTRRGRWGRETLFLFGCCRPAYPAPPPGRAGTQVPRGLQSRPLGEGRPGELPAAEGPRGAGRRWDSGLVSGAVPRGLRGTRLTSAGRSRGCRRAESLLSGLRRGAQDHRLLVSDFRVRWARCLCLFWFSFAK